MSFSAAEKIRLLVVLGILCWVEEFLLGEDKLEHGTEFLNHSKNRVFFRFVVKLFSSAMNKAAIHSLKKLLSFHT